MKIKDEIQLEDVLKLDVRVCLILEANRIPKKDKLIKLKIDTGTDILECVTNLGNKFEPEDFENKRIPFVLNLPPFKIANIESLAMIFVPELDGEVYINSLDLPIGSIYLK